jgi:hypothetical protein
MPTELYFFICLLMVYLTMLSAHWIYLKVILQISGVVTEAWKQGPNLWLQKSIAVSSSFISLIFQRNTALPTQ